MCLSFYDSFLELPTCFILFFVRRLSLMWNISQGCTTGTPAPMHGPPFATSVKTACLGSRRMASPAKVGNIQSVYTCLMSDKSYWATVLCSSATFTLYLWSKIRSYDACLFLQNISRKNFANLYSNVGKKTEINALCDDREMCATLPAALFTVHRVDWCVKTLNMLVDWCGA